jgi:hypothetical protein
LCSSRESLEDQALWAAGRVPMAPSNNCNDSIGKPRGAVSVIKGRKLSSRFALKLNEFFPCLAKQQMILILEGCRGMM